MKDYYILAVNEGPRGWSLAFGDYDKSVVSEERKEAYYYLPLGCCRILKVEHSQRAIEEAIKGLSL